MFEQRQLLRYLPENLHASPEFRFVAACSWLPNSENILQQNQIIESLSKSNFIWNDITVLIRWHGVVGQFCSVMEKMNWFNVPNEATEALRRIRMEHVARALGQVAEMSRIGSKFAEAGIVIIPLKGVALSQEIYGNPCMRSSCDLDILVKPEDVSRGEQLLTLLGYRHALGFHGMHENQKRHIINTLHHHEYVNDTIGITIELHWRSYLWTKEQGDELWSTSRPLPWLNCNFHQLSSENLILFLMDHGARHGWPCLKWLSDVAMLLENHSEEAWLSLINHSTFFDLQRVVFQTALLIQWFYCIELPQCIQQLVATDAVVRKVALQAASQLLASGDDIPFLEKKFPGISTALRVKRLKPATPIKTLFRSSLITYLDFNAHPLPDHLFWLYAILRPYFWFRRRCMKQ